MPATNPIPFLFRRATVWLSDDRDRLPVRIEADLFVGKVYADLVERTSAP